jgi:hypothetical protein
MIIAKVFRARQYWFNCDRIYQETAQVARGMEASSSGVLERSAASVEAIAK